jgi:membrane carboxypeptidase/penicillin-binding protein
MRICAKLLFALISLFLLVIAVQFCVAFVRTPAIVAHAERSGRLVLDPSEFSEQRLQWLIKVQDPTSYHHHGVELRAPGAGYTTITQGLIKVSFFNSSFKPGFLRWRKIQQTIIALALSARVPKDEQLRLFVNLAYMGTPNGHSIVGFSQAAQEYFGKSFLDLTDEEYLSLVAVLVAPERFSPRIHPIENKQRVTRIRRLLAGSCVPASHADVEYVACAQ